MRSFVLISIVFLALSQKLTYEKGACLIQSKDFYNQIKKAVNQNDVNNVINSLEILSEKVPSYLRACGAEEEAQYYEQQFPKSCTKLLAKQANILVKIMRLYSQDKDKNEKQIIFYTAMLETIYKTQVQKKCPFLVEKELLQVKNKGECAEAAYRFSLVFQQLDNDLAAGKFNNSLSDFGKVIKQMPLALDSCGQHHLASMIRYDFPDQCLTSIGNLVRQAVKLQHNYTHLQWLKTHLKDFTKAIILVKSTCPALAH